METKLVNALPDDVTTLKAIIAKKDEIIAALKHNVEILTKWAFSQRSERRPSNPLAPIDLQGSLIFPEILEAAERIADQTGASGTVEIKTPSSPETKPPSRAKKHGRRKDFPEDLPVVRTTFELPEDKRVCDCCGAPLSVIGEEVTKELERLELTILHEIARLKYGCKKCQVGVKLAPGPNRVIERGLLGVGFISHLLAERFGNHMPYNRLEQKYRGEGLSLSRVVLFQTARRAAELMKPIYDQVRKEALESGYLQTDDTGVLMLDPPNKAAAKTEMWTYRAPGRGTFYEFADPRKRNSPIEVLRNFKGWLQADAHPCYEPLYKPGDIIEVACWAHARRRFIDAETTEPDLAKQAIDLIRGLYVIERRAKDARLSPDDVRALRQREAVPILKAIEDWMTANRPKVLERGPLGMAISYAQKNWAALNRYVEDGRLEIDNNGAERALRPVAVGRKNWTFLGSEVGGATAEVMLTLVMSAREVGIDPRMYLRDVLLRIGTGADIATLTPRGWKERWLPDVAAHRQSIVERVLARQAAAATPSDSAAR